MRWIQGLGEAERGLPPEGLVLCWATGLPPLVPGRWSDPEEGWVTFTASTQSRALRKAHFSNQGARCLDESWKLEPALPTAKESCPCDVSATAFMPLPPLQAETATPASCPRPLLQTEAVYLSRWPGWRPGTPTLPLPLRSCM